MSSTSSGRRRSSSELDRNGLFDLFLFAAGRHMYSDSFLHAAADRFLLQAEREAAHGLAVEPVPGLDVDA